MSLDLAANSLEFANDGLFDSVGESLVLVGENSVVVANFVKNFLPSSLSEETVTLVEGNLNSFVESESSSASSLFNVSETLKTIKQRVSLHVLHR